MGGAIWNPLARGQVRAGTGEPYWLALPIRYFSRSCCVSCRETRLLASFRTSSREPHTSHGKTCAILSWLAVAIHFPSGYSSVPRPVLATHRRAVVSLLAVTNRLPSGLNLASYTISVCPTSACTCLPVLTSHTRAVLAAPAVTTRFPPGLKDTPYSDSVCPVSLTLALPLVVSQMRVVPS